jgi:IS5 family transposase
LQGLQEPCIRAGHSWMTRQRISDKLWESLEPLLPEQTGPNPTGRGKLGSKRHIAVDRQSTPLALVVTDANRHDSKVFEAVLDAIPPMPGVPGRPRRRSEKMHVDKGYGYTHCRESLQRRGITARIARRGVECNERLGAIAGLSSEPMPGLPASASQAWVRMGYRYSCRVALSCLRGYLLSVCRTVLLAALIRGPRMLYGKSPATRTARSTNA